MRTAPITFCRVIITPIVGKWQQAIIQFSFSEEKEQWMGQDNDARLDRFKNTAWLPRLSCFIANNLKLNLINGHYKKTK